MRRNEAANGTSDTSGAASEDRLRRKVTIKTDTRVLVQRVLDDCY